MSTTPQANPTADDLAREVYYATIAATTPPPATYKGRARGKTKDSSWRTNIALWEAYPALPVAPLAAGNKAGADAWLRMEAIIVQKMFEEKPGNQAPAWNPGKPTWPLPTPPKSWSAGSKFAARRPWKKTVPQTRYHTGIDLAASPGTPVLAPEAGTIIAPNTGWEYNAQTGKGVKALIMQTDSGLTILLGGIRPDSAIVKAGQKVQAGEKLAEVGRYPLGDSMLHFTLHDALLSEKEVNARKSWPFGQPPPANVIDPAAYLGAAANNPKYSMVGFVGQGDEPGLVVNDVEGGELFEGTEEATPFVSASDGRTGTKPCVGKECVKTDAVAWYNALNSYRNAAYPLHVYASKLPSPTPASIAASGVLNDAASFVSQAIDPNEPAALPLTNWGDATSEYLNLAYAVREAIDTLTAFVASASAPGNEQAPDKPKNPGPLPPTPKPPAKSSGGGLGIVAGLGAAAVLGVTFYVLTSKRASRASKVAAAALMIALPGCGPVAPEPLTGTSNFSSSTTAATWRTTDVPTPSSGSRPTTSSTSNASGTSSTGQTSTTSGASSEGDGDSGQPPEPELPRGCECRTSTDCTGGAICGPGGICVFSCDPGCPVACQLAPPNFCLPPCHIPCALVVSGDGEHLGDLVSRGPDGGHRPRGGRCVDDRHRQPLRGGGVTASALAGASGSPDPDPVGRTPVSHGSAASAARRVGGIMCDMMTSTSNLLLSGLIGAATVACGGVVVEGTSGAPSDASDSSPTTTSASTDTTRTASTLGSDSSTSISSGATSTSSTGEPSGSSVPATTTAPVDLPTQCPEPDCDPVGGSCPGEQLCHPALRVCLEPCSRDCQFYCVSDDTTHYDPNGWCPRCDTGAHPGECIVEHGCVTDTECEPFGQKCALWLGWCMDVCTSPQECEWQCIDANDNKIGTDLCSFCDVSKGLEP